MSADSKKPPRPAPDLRQELGHRGEAKALSHLQAQGLTLVTRNWKAPSRPGFGGHGGELDLVMRDGDVLVIVEVRSASAKFAGDVAYTIGPAKRHRLATLAQLYLARLDWRPRGVRFDVVTLKKGLIRWDLRWYRNAFEC